MKYRKNKEYYVRKFNVFPKVSLCLVGVYFSYYYFNGVCWLFSNLIIFFKKATEDKINSK